mmetsp:Transcript_7005/g.10030  ORF Transcript_7005/g.10030 Transcript_7005/m.10030 type:complete len:220 (-) Transcript_7005:92-751(-)
MTTVTRSFLALLALLCLRWSNAGDSDLATIAGKLVLPDDTPVNNTRIVLNDGEYTTYSKLDGSFSVYNVGPGVHLLDVYSHKHMFSQVKIQLLAGAMDDPKCIEYVFPGAPKTTTKHPLVLTAHAKYEYFEPRQGFSIMGIFKNPMLLMMIVSGGLMFLMPKMMENLEPEEQERMKKQMEMQQDPTKAFSKLWGDLTGAPEEPTTAQIKDKKRKGKKDH